MIKKLVISFALAALTAVSAQTYRVTFFQPTVVKGSEFKPGDYRIRIEDNKVVILDGKREVEVPATVDKNGVHGVPLGKLPSGFAGLLMNQAAVHDLTAEAVIKKSRSAALQALLVDPVVNQYARVEDMLDTMIAYQEKWLGYLK